MKENKGITLTSLIIVIVLILILTGMTVSTSTNRFKTNNLKKMQNDIELLNDKIATYYVQYGGIPVKKDDSGNIFYTYSTIDFDTNANDDNNYYIIDLEAIGNITLNYGEEGYKNPNTSEDVYIINNKTHTVYYVKGIEDITGKVHHSLQLKGSANQDIIPPTQPQIKIISGDLNSDGKYTSDVEIEIIPGRDNWSGVNKTTYSINEGTETDITTLTNNILKITENGTYTIKLKTYDNNSQISQEEISFEIKKIPEKAYIVTLGQGSYFKEASYINKITTVTFVKGIDNTAVSNAIKTYELGNITYGTEKNEIMGWIDSNYNLYIGSESTIYSKSLEYAFYNMNAVTNITFNNLDTSECTSMHGMFANCIELATLDLSSFNANKVTNMQAMFYKCNKLTTLDLRNFDTSQVTTMHSMFYGCSELTTLDLSSFNTNKVSNMYGVFCGCSKLKTIYVKQYDETTNTGWTTSAATNSADLFNSCVSIVGGNGTTYNSSYTNATYARIDTAEQPGYFTNILDKAE